MYCIKCGVELSDSEEKCPLCGLAPYHPELTKNRKVKGKPYPNTVAKAQRSFKRVSIMFMVTWITAVVLFTLMLVDFSLNHDMIWSRYAMISILLFYVMVFLPQWFKRPNPVIFVSIDMVAITLFLALICIFTGGKWFFSFAMPMMIFATVISVTIVTLVKYVKKGYLFIAGGGFIALGVAMVVMEILINITFNIRNHLVWSYAPLIVMALTGLFLIVVGIVKPFRDALYKIFFV
ncbi:MAG: zinc ribbon domain-containing protein [Clostridia bacterium]|nr:zinc ribbon domain-containing protein [Clostridia bacterium]